MIWKHVVTSLTGIIALGYGLFMLFLKLSNLQVSLYFFDDFIVTIAFASTLIFLGVLLFVALWQDRRKTKPQ